MERIKKEALIFLGYKNAEPDKKTLETVESCIDEINSLKSAKYIYRIFDIITENETVDFLGTTLCMKSRDIARHLGLSKKSAIICATLGSQVDFLINKYNKTDLSRAVIFDACATSFIESVCDKAQDEINLIASDEGLKITPRFSPGYGDLPIFYQSDIIKITNADKLINLTVTPDSILIPTKSVTAFIGFTDKVTQSCGNKCLTCNFRENCKFKREV